MIQLVNYWDFPANRDPDIPDKIGINALAENIATNDWLIPPSRDEKHSETSSVELEKESLSIHSFLQDFSQEMSELWYELPNNLIDKIKTISKLIIVDVLYSINSIEQRNETKTTEEYVFGAK